ncbi:D-alanyl-D-alanine carboxypeptidase/D-alanyl-D-alanine-endopeptidase [Streptomyces sp. NPDC007088]|uniref:D-alanyl-D-alanine carboxypeptidase/D-alanyl-D-alanine endopeptidase n=1 Tax=Streptomyces sp. NPDC007088 TaxID=3364773 RepID=UPI0036C47BB0
MPEVPEVPEPRLTGRPRRWPPALSRLPAWTRLQRPPRLPAWTRPQRPPGTARVTAAAAVLGLLVAGTAAALAGPFDSSGQRVAEARRAGAAASGAGAAPAPGAPRGEDSPRLTSAGLPAPAPSAAAVLTTLGSATRVPARGSLSRRLDPLLDKPALGERPVASVVDVASGTVLYDAHAGTARTPASVTKLATAVAALDTLGADHRIETRVVGAEDGGSGGDGKGARKGRLTLVGGGDPTLTARARPDGFASLRELAARTARALKKDGAARSYIVDYDVSLYSGPRLHPIGPNENIAPVTPLMADEGRLDDSRSGPAARSTRPDKDAAERFRDLLRERGVKVGDEVGQHRAPTGARTLASVSSAPLSALVERMLTYSDNDIAEGLARQTALAAHEPASFDGGGKATRARLGKLGLPLDGARFADGSGLDRADRLSPALLTGLLAHAGDKDRPALRPVLSGLPVAGFTGTLATRYNEHTNAAGTGMVRAKTGTLTGVNTLAGTVVTRSGRLLAFAYMTQDAPSPLEAQAALDRMAAALTDT